MDANGQRFWLLAGAADWHWRQRTRVDASCGALRLAGERRIPPPADPPASHATANSALERVPRTLDSAGNVAWWSPVAGAVVVRSHLPGEALRLPLVAAPTDLVVDSSGILYVATEQGVRLHDLRGRWDDVLVDTGDLVPWRLCAAQPTGVWILERTSGRMGRITGRPLRPVSPDAYAGTTFRPDPENCDPPRFQMAAAPGLDEEERAVGIADSLAGGPALLTWIGSEGAVRLRTFDPARAEWTAPLLLDGARYAYALEFVRKGRAIVRVPGLRDAPAFVLDEADTDGRLLPAGEVYPLEETALEAPFAHRVEGPPRYPVDLQADDLGVRPLHPLSFNALALVGEARHFDAGNARLIDSRDPRTVWHRLHVEARIPPGTGFVLWCSATDEATPPPVDAAGSWAPHHFGETPATPSRAPRGAYEQGPSEIPHHPGIAPWPREPGRAGLWSVLMQDTARPVRRLTGRYLWVRIVLYGDGRASPEIAALRIRSDRFSYRDEYLPRLYRETHFGAEAEGDGSPGQPASPADFLERFLANVEGILTPIEDRIAAAHLLSDPASAPEDGLEWLAGWIGVSFDPALPDGRRRAWLAAAPDLARFHGTRRGLELALEVASGGGVSGGEIVVIEDFRLRRLLATLLGVDAGGREETDPLLPGLTVSGNSIVGDTLILGDAERRELMALYRREAATGEENRAVVDFHARLAHRATVLVHQEVEPVDLGLLRRIVDLESPAHADVRVVAATWPLLVGISSLVGVDTYLRQPRRSRPARVDHSPAGRDYVLAPALLDPRLAGASAPRPEVPPVADAGEDFTTSFGESFDLDGSGSAAAPGRRIDRYRWRRLPPD